MDPGLHSSDSASHARSTQSGTRVVGGPRGFWTPLVREASSCKGLQSITGGNRGLLAPPVVYGRLRASLAGDQPLRQRLLRQQQRRTRTGRSKPASALGNHRKAFEALTGRE